MRRLLLAVALSGDLRVDELAAIADADGARRRASTPGCCVVDGERVRASHPLLAAAAQQALAPRASGASCTARWPRVVADEELRALHLALATDAARRGARGDGRAAAAERRARAARASEAVALGRARAAAHAAAATPSARERLLALAELPRARGRAAADDRAARARARRRCRRARCARARWLLLAEGARVADDRRASSATSSARWPRARTTRRCARTCWPSRRADAPSSARRADRARPRRGRWRRCRPRAAPGRDVERIALYALGWARALRGRPIDDLCERFARGVGRGPLHRRVAGARSPASGSSGAASSTRRGRVLTRLLALADERGEPASYALLRLHLCELELRAGEWDAARAAARRVGRVGRGRAADPADVRALPRAARRRPRRRRTRPSAGRRRDRARRGDRRRAGTGSRRCARAASPRCSRASRRARPSACARSGSTREREGVDEPGVFPVAPDLVEALAELGELDEARAVTDRLRALAERQEHPWGLATAQRCARARRARGPGLRRGRRPRRSRDAAAAYGELGLRFDRGALAAQPRPRAAAAQAVGRRARVARARGRRVRRARLRRLGRAGARRARARRRRAGRARAAS